MTYTFGTGQKDQMASQLFRYETNSFKTEYPPLSTIHSFPLPSPQNLHTGVATDWSYNVPNGGYIGIGDSEKAARVGTTFSSDHQKVFAQGFTKITPDTKLTGDV
ncbi:hypothetical protein THARTR1_05085 [Trichoderma harzianum]|uniref:Uncharacterized protein n=1 Tax=Trichoderma harzianum TaxID=5544 RepID=A0A2K0U9S9_TRIHA|nr:hypothetical protein THARTR1_05085 [Trichoderma harzianum]